MKTSQLDLGKLPGLCAEGQAFPWASPCHSMPGSVPGRERCQEMGQPESPLPHPAKNRLQEKQIGNIDVEGLSQA